MPPAAKSTTSTGNGTTIRIRHPQQHRRHGLHDVLVAFFLATSWLPPSHAAPWGWSLASRTRTRHVGPAYSSNRKYGNKSHHSRPSISPQIDAETAAITKTASTSPEAPVPCIPRGGQGADAFVKAVGTITAVLVAAGKTVLPPTVAVGKAVVTLYRSLPKDAILAQVGLVYCFAGGYYPTLFSSLQAAQQYGWNTMTAAVGDLVDEALRVIVALEEQQQEQNGFDNVLMEEEEEEVDVTSTNYPSPRSRRRHYMLQQASVVFATVDPMKINQAAAALYTTWLGVSSVLEKEYARVITLSLTMADFLETIFQFVLQPPLYLVVPDKYHQWVPVVIGWMCKGVAMNIAWRMQRLMTAATSAMAGGLMVARACRRMIAKRIQQMKNNKNRRRAANNGGGKWFGRKNYNKQNQTARDMLQEELQKTSPAAATKRNAAAALEEIVGCLVAGLGFYTQFEAQWRSGFSFRVPFPIHLITWPFDFLERWIQWQITKK